MQFKLGPVHRLARLNYLTRSVSFGFSFTVVLANLSERGFNTGTLILGVLTLLVYPQLAYVHAAKAADSKNAEIRNMNIDSAIMGVWAAQFHFALWPAMAVVGGICLNNAVCGGSRRVLVGLLYLVAAALGWALLLQQPVELTSGPVVTALCFIGLMGYITLLGVSLYNQNHQLLATRDILRTSNEQFRFIADHAGDLVTVLDPRYRFRYASLAHEKYFEAGKFAAGREWLYLVHPDDRPHAEEFLDLLRDSPRIERAQLRMVPDRGFPFVVEIQGNPVRSDGGYLQMIVLVCRDLTTPQL